MNRAAALDILRRRGDETPRDDIRRFCGFAGSDESRFFATAERFRNPAIWRRRQDGVWHIPEFLIPDWVWS
jgi:hypothetical protein